MYLSGPFSRCLLALVACLLFAGVALADQRLFWKAQSDDGVVWLLGSLHFGEEAMYPLPAHITDALAGSGILVVEVDITAMPVESVAVAISQRGLYQDGSSLRRLVDDSTWDELAEAAGAFGLPLPLLERQKPWFAAMTLTALALEQKDFRSDLGLDAHVMGLAVSDGIPIVALESVEEQIDFLDNLSLDTQILMLEQTLAQIEDTERHFRAMLDTWQRGDADGMAEIILEEFQGEGGSNELYEVLIVERNDTMRRDIRRLLQDHDVIFVIVGAGHMVGEDGIIAGLEAEGFRVVQPAR